MSARVGLVADPCFELHVTGLGHPERLERVRGIRESLESSGVADRCRRFAPVSVDPALLEAVHDPDYVARVAESCARGATLLDSMDTAICEASDRIARLAAGSVTALALAVADDEIERGFAAVRPPGHHAEHDLAMGFCLYNNVAVAARALLNRADIDRVLIFDWDVHHGNGTQHLFEDDPSVFYASLHQWPLYPGTGARHETGTGAGAGTTLNGPLPAGAGDAEFAAFIDDELAPAAAAFAPDFILLSCGFDAHQDDPLGQLEVTPEGFRDGARKVVDLAGELACGRLVSVLEGGYDLEALAASAVDHVRVLLEHDGGRAGRTPG